MSDQPPAPVIDCPAATRLAMTRAEAQRRGLIHGQVVTVPGAGRCTVRVTDQVATKKPQ